MRQLVDKLVAAGQRSARVMTLTALQLCGVWGLRPLPAMLYRDVLQGLCLYGLAEDNGGDKVGGSVQAGLLEEKRMHAIHLRRIGW